MFRTNRIFWDIKLTAARFTAKRFFTKAAGWDPSLAFIRSVRLKFIARIFIIPGDLCFWEGSMFNECCFAEAWGKQANEKGLKGV